jgi:hypothetical protein
MPPPTDSVFEWIKLGVNILAIAVTPAFAFWYARRLEHFKIGTQDAQAQRARRAEYLKNQIEKLYGPLSFYLEVNTRIHETMMGIDEASAQYRVPRDEIDRVIAATNIYARELRGNNEAMVSLLKSQWGWCDIDDTDSFGSHIIATVRSSVEFTEERTSRLPLEYYEHKRLAVMMIYHPDLFERARRKLREKQAELSGLSGAPNSSAGKHPSLTLAMGHDTKDVAPLAISSNVEAPAGERPSHDRASAGNK